MTPVSVSAHFGEWLQGRLGPDGPVVLVTLHCSRLKVTAPGKDPLPFGPEVLAQFAAELGLDALPSGIEQNFAPGIGAGASTAALVALARAGGFDGTPRQLARACIATEGASDPLMFPHPDRLLWASREGQILQDLPPLPRAEILGGQWGAPERTRADDRDFDDVSDLVKDWTTAAERADLAGMAAIATTSYSRCQTRRGPQDPMLDLARSLGALGVVRAHTGSARGLVFAPGNLPRHGAEVLGEAGLTDVMSFETGGT